MAWDDFINTEVFSNFGFWLIGGGGFLALAGGFKLADYWGNGTIPFFSKILILIGAWVAAYFITLKNESLPFG